MTVMEIAQQFAKPRMVHRYLAKLYNNQCHLGKFENNNSKYQLLTVVDDFVDLKKCLSARFMRATIGADTTENKSDFT